MSFFFFYLSPPPPPSSLWARVHWASRLPWCLFGSGIISHVYDTYRQSGRTERGDEGRWWRTPAPGLWGQALLSPLSLSPPRLSYTFSLLHSNRLTNVPWKFTLDAGSRESRGKVTAAAEGLEWDAEAACRFSCSLASLTLSSSLPLKRHQHPFFLNSQFAGTILTYS